MKLLKPLLFQSLETLILFHLVEERYLVMGSRHLRYANHHLLRREVSCVSSTSLGAYNSFRNCLFYKCTVYPKYGHENVSFCHSNLQNVYHSSGNRKQMVSHPCGFVYESSNFPISQRTCHSHEMDMQTVSHRCEREYG